MSDAPASLPSDDERFVREYLVAHDVACPNCGYNLRGLERARCPECGVTFRFAARPIEDGLTEAERMALWLRTHDLVCKKCKRNLRGHTSNICPGCGTSYMLQHLPGERATEPRKRHPLVPRWNVMIIVAALALLMVPPVRQGIMWLVQQLERVFK